MHSASLREQSLYVVVAPGDTLNVYVFVAVDALVVVTQLLLLYVNINGGVPTKFMVNVALPLQSVWLAPHVAVGRWFTLTVTLPEGVFTWHGVVSPSALK